MRNFAGHSVVRLLQAVTAFITFFSLPLIHAAAQTNQGSPLGTNLGFVNSSTTAQPFLNIFKTAIGWYGTVASGTQYSELQNAFALDANGYPLSMQGVGPAAGQTFIEIDALILRTLGIQAVDGTQTAPFYNAGNYVLLYSGTGKFNFNFDCINSQIVSSAPGRIVINIPAPSAAGCQIGITSGYVTNIAFVFSPDSTGSNVGVRESLYTSGEVFDPVFISRVSPFKTFRFMDWMQVNASVQTNWSGRPQPTQAFWGVGSSPGALGVRVDPMPQGIPIEVMVALCNKVNADGWFNMPPMSTDDYVAQFATLVHNGGTDSSGRFWPGLNANLKAYVEYGDEIWNSGSVATFVVNADGSQPFNANAGHNVGGVAAIGWNAFPGSGDDWGAALWGGVLRAVQNGATWKSVWGADAGRVVRILGGQSGYPGRNLNLLGLTASSYGGNGTYFSGTAGSNVDAFATAPYFGYDVPDTFTLDQLFTEMMSGGLVSGGYPGGMIKQSLDWMAQNYAAASQYGLALVAYEGGQGFESTSDTALQALYLNANRDPRMGTAYTTYFNGWRSAGGTLFVHYNDIGRYTKWGYWSALENVLQTTSPKYAALTNFISANPCWWAGCNTSGTSGTPPTSPGGTVLRSSTPDSSLAAPPATPVPSRGSATQATSVPSPGPVTAKPTASVVGVGAGAGANIASFAVTTPIHVAPNFPTAPTTGNIESSGPQPAGTSAPSSGMRGLSTNATVGVGMVNTFTPPTVAITSPANGASVQSPSTNAISVSASSPIGISSIIINSDGRPLQTCVNATSCSATWDGANSLTEGTHTISAIAVDTAGHQADASITIVYLK